MFFLSNKIWVRIFLSHPFLLLEKRAVWLVENLRWIWATSCYKGGL